MNKPRIGPSSGEPRIGPSDRGARIGPSARGARIGPSARRARIGPSARRARIGLFGGTFDPVHYGHLRPAIEIAEHFRLDALHLLPNHRPVHRGQPRASTDDRIAMLELALAGIDTLAIDTREAFRDRPSWSVDTLTEWREEHPEACLIFFMGVDAFARFDTWGGWERILELANLGIMDRPGASLSSFAEQLIATQRSACGERIEDHSTGVIQRFEVTQLSISATEIRRCVSEDQDIRFLLPDQVTEYIVKHGLYRQSAA